MSANSIRLFVVVAVLLCACRVLGQEQKRLTLDVVVTAKSGALVSGLQQQDFTLLDDKKPQPITSFQAIDGRQAAIEIVLVIDGVNTSFDHVAYERDQIDKFLRSDQGKLAHPTALAVLTDTGLQFNENFSADGNALSSALGQSTVSLRNWRRGGLFDDEQIFQTSLEGLQQLIEREVPRAGRKIILWISPGWPLFSNVVSDNITDKEKRRLFEGIVDTSTQLLKGRITLYSVDPLGTADAGGFRVFYWKEFVKGVSKPSQVLPGDLGLEVIATQSGGLALNSSNNVVQLLQKCISDLGTYYELSFAPHADDKSNGYHTLEVRVDKPGVNVRTRQGYYSQP